MGVGDYEHGFNPDMDVMELFKSRKCVRIAAPMVPCRERDGHHGPCASCVRGRASSCSALHARCGSHVHVHVRGGIRCLHPHVACARAARACLSLAWLHAQVRFSKLPFRHVVRSYGTDLVYTPMIMADSFVASQKARDVELTTNCYDKPVVVQFAANTAKQFGDAAELVAGKVAGVDLNCGCPQRWAIQEGVGCALLKKPELVKDMVREAKERSGLHVSVKIRIAPDLSETVQILKLAESVGVSWVTVHGRTASSKPSDPVDYEAIKLVREHASVPLVANGSINSLVDVDMVHHMGACVRVQVVISGAFIIFLLHNHFIT